MTSPIKPELDRSAFKRLLESVEDALELLQDYPPAASQVPSAAPLPSLLEQCRLLCQDSPAPEPVRSIHHFARTGGTLISRCLSAMPNVALLSEIDPLSSFMFDGKMMFRPTDTIYAARTNFRPVGGDTAAAMFDAGIGVLHDNLRGTGRHMVVRDHAHSHFCTDRDFDARPSLRDILARGRELLSIVTVRNPVNSWISLKEKDWVHFTPRTLQEYARRYTAFLDLHADLEIHRYEDFIADPESVLQAMCATLDLPYSPHFQDLLSIVPMTGDPRPGGKIRHDLSKRAIPDDVLAEIEATPDFIDLCLRLGYDPAALRPDT